MKRFTLLAVLASFAFAGCVKVEEKKTVTSVAVPELQPIKIGRAVLTKEGMKCDFIGENEHKEIFVTLEIEEDKKTLGFHDFLENDKINLVSGTFDRYKLYSYPAQRALDSDALVGEGVMIHEEPATLSEDKVMVITGRVTLNPEGTGKLERKLMTSKGNKITSGEFQEIAKIDNCQEFIAEGI